MIIYYHRRLPLLKNIQQLQLLPTTFNLMNNIRSSSSISSSSTTDPRILSILERLRSVDTAAICDADKSLLLSNTNTNTNEDQYKGIRLMNQTIQPRNMNNNNNSNNYNNTHHTNNNKMIGIAKTVQCTKPNDFLAVLQGLNESKQYDILCVNTLNSTKAVAGGLFCQEAMRKRMSGIIIDGPIRDIDSLNDTHNHNDNHNDDSKLKNIFMYSTSVTPYSGTIQSLGIIQPDIIQCGGIDIHPGDIIIGDCDGVVVGSLDTMERVIGSAEQIVDVEGDIMNEMIDKGRSLHSMTNFEEHVELIRQGKESSLKFTL